MRKAQAPAIKPAQAKQRKEARRLKPLLLTNTSVPSCAMLITMSMAPGGLQLAKLTMNEAMSPDLKV